MIGPVVESSLSLVCLLATLLACHSAGSLRRPVIANPGSSDGYGEPTLPTCEINPAFLEANRLDPVYPEFRCLDLGCEPNVRCSLKVLVVTHCGLAKCRYCPEGSPVGNLVVKAWCSYAGIGGESAIGFVTKFGGKFIGPICLPGSIDEHELLPQAGRR